VSTQARPPDPIRFARPRAALKQGCSGEEQQGDQRGTPDELRCRPPRPQRRGSSRCGRPGRGHQDTSGKTCEGSRSGHQHREQQAAPSEGGTRTRPRPPLIRGIASDRAAARSGEPVSAGVAEGAAPADRDQRMASSRAVNHAPAGLQATTEPRAGDPAGQKRQQRKAIRSLSGQSTRYGPPWEWRAAGPQPGPEAMAKQGH